MPKKVTKEVVSSEVFKLHDSDTGSVEVQIWLLTQEITELQSHLALHKKDFDAKRSLLKKVARRRAFLKYLKSKKLSTYNSISKQVSVKV
jgi:small subunit ribosomal protein S15